MSKQRILGEFQLPKHPSQIRYHAAALSAAAAFLVGVSVSQAAVVSRAGSNNSPANAQNVSGSFSSGAHSSIGSQFGIDPASTPWVSITASGGDSFDFYSFTTYFTGDISIDTDNTNFDTEIALWLDNGNGTFLLLGGMDDIGRSLDPGSSSGLDSHMHFADLAAGKYVVGVGEFNIRYFDEGFSGNTLDFDDTYTLQLTAEGSFPSPLNESPPITAIPEPGSAVALCGLLMGGILLRSRRRAA